MRSVAIRTVLRIGISSMYILYSSSISVTTSPGALSLQGIQTTARLCPITEMDDGSNARLGAIGDRLCIVADA